MNETRLSIYDESLLTEETANSIVLLCHLVSLGLHLCGIVTNTLNILTFWRCGLNNSVNVGFMSLAVSDLLYQVLYASMRTLASMGRIQNPKAYESYLYRVGAYLVTYWAKPFFDTSVVITCFIAVQRACLVVLPLQFKGMFTVMKTKVVIAVIFTVLIALHLPLLVTQGLRNTWNSAANLTLTVVWFAPNYEEIWVVTNIVTRNVFYPAAEVTSIISVIVLARKLRQSSSFRRQAASAAADPMKDKTCDTKNSKTEGTDARETQLIKSVTLVVSMFAACNFLIVFDTILTSFFPEFRDFGRYGLVHRVELGVIGICVEINACLNILVYWHTNRNFRAAFPVCGRKQIGEN